MAYRKLLDAHLPAVTRYVQRMLTRPGDTEDIVQEVFLRLWTQAAGFDQSKARLSTWLHNIAHNLCIDLFRKQKRIQLTDETGDSTGGEEPEVVLAATNRSAIVRNALSSLPERQRSALILSYYQGLSNRETADILELSLPALESLLARARRTLKQELQQEPGQ